MVKSTVGDTNIFNITQPMNYRCQVMHYHNKLSRLYLAVFKGQATMPALYFLFSDVGYMDCPMNWTGADFRIAPAEDCINLLLERGLIGQAILQFPNAYASITDYAHLYIAQTQTDTPVRLIASSASLLQQLPNDL